MRPPAVHDKRKTVLLIAVRILHAASAAIAQNTPSAPAAPAKHPDAAGPAFEVATVRSANREDGRHWFGVKVDASGRLTVSQVPLDGLVHFAWLGFPGEGKVTTDRGLPKWITSEQFDISARVDEAYTSGWDKLTDKERMDQVRPMLKKLLVERFHLKVREETRDTPVYALVQAKGGAHVKEVSAPPDLESDAMSKWMADNPGKPAPGSIMCSGDTCTATAVRMSNAVGQIQGSSQAERMVIDETGLKGYYDFSFKFTPVADESPMHRMEEDLGMKFVPRTVPIKTYVIESAEKPSLDGD